MEDRRKFKISKLACMELLGDFSYCPPVQWTYLNSVSSLFDFLLSKSYIRYLQLGSNQFFRLRFYVYIEIYAAFFQKYFCIFFLLKQMSNCETILIAPIILCKFFQFIYPNSRIPMFWSIYFTSHILISKITNYIFKVSSNVSKKYFVFVSELKMFVALCSWQ